jgi:hypothetical protein
MSSTFLQGVSFFVLVLVIAGAIFGGFGAL